MVCAFSPTVTTELSLTLSALGEYSPAHVDTGRTQQERTGMLRHM